MNWTFIIVCVLIILIIGWLIVRGGEDNDF